MSTAGSVTSPCTSSRSPSRCIASSVRYVLRRSVTPASLLVVAPAGYSLAPTTPAAFARAISSGARLSVRYSDISGSNDTPAGTAARMRSRYATACAAVVTGGRRLGMISARANCAAECGTTDAMAAPSRTCRCQSSGRVMVRVIPEGARD